MIECNVDDMRGEEFEVLMERLFKKGAYDVFFTPIYMKKQRPGTKISVLCSEDNIDEIKEVLFINSSTIGLRYQEVFREKLERTEDKVMGKWGNVDVKVCSYKGRIIKVKPEYDRCKEIANAKDVSVNEVFLDALRNYKF